MLKLERIVSLLAYAEEGHLGSKGALYSKKNNFYRLIATTKILSPLYCQSILQHSSLQLRSYRPIFRTPRESTLEVSSHLRQHARYTYASMNQELTVELTADPALGTSKDMAPCHPVWTKLLVAGKDGYSLTLTLTRVIPASEPVDQTLRIG